jgi:anti-anti-sigma factor
MDVRVEDTGAGTVISLAGHFDAPAVVAMRPLVEDIPEQTRGRVLIDLSAVVSMDSAAIGFVAYLFKRLAAQHRLLLLVGPKGQPKRLLESLRINRVIDIIPDVPAEVRSGAPASEQKPARVARQKEAADA